MPNPFDPNPTPNVPKPPDPPSPSPKPSEPELEPLRPQTPQVCTAAHVQVLRAMVEGSFEIAEVKIFNELQNNAPWLAYYIRFKNKAEWFNAATTLRMYLTWPRWIANLRMRADLYWSAGVEE